MNTFEAAAVASKAEAAFPAWSALGPNAKRSLLMEAATALERKAEAFTAVMASETGATRGWAKFNVGLAAGMIREAAAITTQISGEVIRSDKPGCLSMGLRAQWA